MLRLLRQRCACHCPDSNARLGTHNVDALSFLASHPPESRDLIATHFFLDCLTQQQVDTLAAAIAPHLAPNALWLVSDFRIPRGAMALPATILVRSLYFAFRSLTGLRVTRLPDHSAALARAGLVRIAHHDSLAGILTTELWSLHPNAPSQLNPPVNT
jgi:hypothetical protein